MLPSSTSQAPKGEPSYAALGTGFPFWKTAVAPYFATISFLVSSPVAAAHVVPGGELLGHRQG